MTDGKMWQIITKSKNASHQREINVSLCMSHSSGQLEHFTIPEGAQCCCLNIAYLLVAPLVIINDTPLDYICVEKHSMLQLLCTSKHLASTSCVLVASLCLHRQTVRLMPIL